ncbi:MAG: hypothetical protein WBL05_14100 [Brooklawnia sp.]|uniref:hypothetical protein n=1 Tax=Brooklawnia sp. TaxID=2699740 RepID=UPI003C77CE70
MATKPTAPKSLKPIETVEAATFDEALPAIEAAIQQVVNTFGVTVQRARLKGIRALAYQALVESIEAGDLEALTQTQSRAVPAGRCRHRDDAAGIGKVRGDRPDPVLADPRAD